MQPLSSRKVGSPKFFATRLRLPITAAITTVLFIIFLSAGVQSEGGAGVETPPTTCPNQLLQNPGFDLSNYPYSDAPLNWNISQWIPVSQLSVNRIDNAVAGRIVSVSGNDAWFWQEVTVQPDTLYLLTGFIKTENVKDGAGANLSLIGTWTHTEGIFGTTNWTRVSLWFNSGSSTRCVCVHRERRAGEIGSTRSP